MQHSLAAMNTISGVSDHASQPKLDLVQSAALFGSDSLLVAAAGAGNSTVQPMPIPQLPYSSVADPLATAAPSSTLHEESGSGVAVGKKRRRAAAEGTIVSSSGGAAGREAANAAARASQAAAAAAGASAGYFGFPGASMQGMLSAGVPAYPPGSLGGAAGSSSAGGMTAAPAGIGLVAAAGGAGYGSSAGAGAGAVAGAGSGSGSGYAYPAAIPLPLSLGGVISSALVAMTVAGRAGKKARASAGGAGGNGSSGGAGAAAPSDIYMQQAAAALAMTGRPLSRTDAKKIFALTDRDIETRYAEEVLAKGGELKKRPKFELEHLKAWCIAKYGSQAAFAARLQTIASSGFKRSISRAFGPRSILSGGASRRFGYGFGDDDDDDDEEDEEGVVGGEITRRCCADDCDSISAPLDCKNRMCRACCLETQKVAMLPMFKCKRHR